MWLAGEWAFSHQSACRWLLLSDDNSVCTNLVEGSYLMAPSAVRLRPQAALACAVPRVCSVFQIQHLAGLQNCRFIKTHLASNKGFTNAGSST